MQSGGLCPCCSAVLPAACVFQRERDYVPPSQRLTRSQDQVNATRDELLSRLNTIHSQEGTQVVPGECLVTLLYHTLCESILSTTMHRLLALYLSTSSNSMRQVAFPSPNLLTCCARDTREPPQGPASLPRPLPLLHTPCRTRYHKLSYRQHGLSTAGHATAAVRHGHSAPQPHTAASTGSIREVQVAQDAGNTTQ